MSAEPMDIIQQHINLLGELPASHKKFRTDLNEKIKRIQGESDKLKALLDNIGELKTKMARSSRDIDAVRVGYKEEINELKEEAKKSKASNTNKLREIAENLSKHTATLNEIKGATDGINLDELERNVKALQDALNTEVRLPTGSSPGWGALRDNVQGAIEGTTGLVTDSEGLPEGWKAAVSDKPDENLGKTYYYNEATDVTQWEKPTSGGRRKSKRSVNMRRKGGRKTRRRRTRRRKGGFRYDMSPQEEKRSRTLRSVKSLRSKKSTKKSKSRQTRKPGGEGKGRRSRRRRNRRKR
jgi:hypothetical protein